MSAAQFPAEHLSAYDVGHRVKVTTTEGAVITDTLTSVVTQFHPGHAGIPHRKKVLVTFQNVGTDSFNGTTRFELPLDSKVKRFVED